AAPATIIITTVRIAAPPQLKNPEISLYASTTIKFKSVGAKTIGVPKSEKLTANITKAVDKIPGITSGNVTVKKVKRPLAPIIFDASSNELSLTLKAATIGHKA